MVLIFLTVVLVIIFFIYKAGENKINKKRQLAKLEKEELEKQRLESEKLKQERLEKERLEKIKLEQERSERERIAREQEELKRKKKALDLQATLEPQIKEFLSYVTYLQNNYIRNSYLKFLDKNYYNTNLSLTQINSKYLTEISEQFLKEWKRLKIDYKYHNSVYLNKELTRCDSLFSNIDGKSLDTQQRNAVVMDEDNELVIAGAGAGKTLTIAAKVAYLVKEKNINPKDILLITFTKKAAEEMEERVVKKLQIPVEVNTFHALGLKYIAQFNGYKPSIEDNPNKIIEKYFRNEIKKNPDLPGKLIEFFGMYLHYSQDLSKFKTMGEYFENNKHINFKSLKGISEDEVNRKKQLEELRKKFGNLSPKELSKMLWNTEEKITYKGERVKSIEELLIANFLFVNGINYEYEKPYPHDTKSINYSQYKPDFYLTDFDIYLEHFAIGKDGRTPSFFSPIESQRYLDGIKWKREIHETFNTKLIETYSYYQFEGVLIDKLKKILLDNNVKFKPLSPEELLAYLEEIKTKSEFLEFIKIIKTFLKLFKSNGYTLANLDSFKNEAKNHNNPFMKNRELLFFEIFEPIYKYYEAELKNSNLIDFDDMINLATDSISHLNPTYQYIIIDEYQDISQSRYKLIKAIKDKTNAAIVAVGDDWQSIYRFAGSDIKLFTRFQDYFGFSEFLRIEKTYRNSQKMIDLAGKFVMKNSIQIKKSLKSDKLHQQPLMILGYQSDKAVAFSQALSKVLNENSAKSVLILGRNNSDIEFLEDNKYFIFNPTENGVEIKSHLYPHAKIFFMTVHKSKGLEADEVIVINNMNHIMGFPNKIADDEILRYVLVEKDQFDYGEERRLFYVALTRTKNHCILLAPILEPSTFIEELKEEGVEYIELEDIKTVSCPRCQTGHLQIKKNSNSGSEFISCSNYPQCTFTTSNLEIIKKPIRCPWCGGYMVTRKGKFGDFLGCINYPYCKNTQS